MTINCAERGFLLVRVRDEIKMTIQAYQTLYESSIAYGMRKALQAEQSKAQILISISNVEGEIEDLEGEVDDLKKKINKMLHDYRRTKQAQKEHQKEIIKGMQSAN